MGTVPFFPPFHSNPETPYPKAFETPVVEKTEVPGVDHGIGPDSVDQFVDLPRAFRVCR